MTAQPDGLRWFPIHRTSTRDDTLLAARKLCRCVRKSFAGVRWREGDTQHQMTWEEVDRGAIDQHPG